MNMNLFKKIIVKIINVIVDSVLLLLFKYFIDIGIKSFVMLVVFVIFFRVFNLHLHFYYKIFLKFIDTCCKNCNNKFLHNSYCLGIKWIINSGRIKEYSEGFENRNVWRPSIVKREHLTKKKFWPHWVFSVIIIRSDRINIQSSGEDCYINVDLRNQGFGLYSNKGKAFLNERINNIKKNNLIRTVDNEVHSDILNKTDIRVDENYYFRWASGGFLPVVKKNNDYWVVLFFRDIFPIGLNTANGASENKNEYKNLNYLIAREFSEELILLKNDPSCFVGSNDRAIDQYTFYLKALSSRNNTNEIINNRDFSHKHKILRERHDKLMINNDNEFHKDIQPLTTRYTLSVQYHKNKFIRISEKSFTHHIIPSINFLESGIEIIWLCQFDLNDNDYIIDGEYHLTSNILIRRPAVLLRLEKLKKIILGNNLMLPNSNGSSSRNDYLGCRFIPRDMLTNNDIFIFKYDIERRKERLSFLQKLKNDYENNRNVITSIKEQYFTKKATIALDSLEREIRMIQRWNNNYLTNFENYFSSKNIQDLPDDLFSLCPVTWKTLDIAFRNNILNLKSDKDN